MSARKSSTTVRNGRSVKVITRTVEVTVPEITAVPSAGAVATLDHRPARYGRGRYHTFVQLSEEWAGVTELDCADDSMHGTVELWSVNDGNGNECLHVDGDTFGLHDTLTRMGWTVERAEPSTDGDQA